MTGIKPEDDPYWSRVKKTVKPLKTGSSKPEDRQEFEALIHVKPGQRRKRLSRSQAPQENKDKKVRRGRVDIDVTIDLHDQTRALAEQILKRGLIRAYNQNKKCALVITGKGARLEGVLRRAFSDWMADPDLRPIIASFAQAHIRHGGSGAWYVFFKS